MGHDAVRNSCVMGDGHGRGQPRVDVVIQTKHETSIRAVVEAYRTWKTSVLLAILR